MKRPLATACLVGLLSGCSGFSGITGLFGGEDNAEPPAPLLPLSSSIPVDTLWRTKVGVGSHGQRVNLKPAVADDRLYVADRKGRVSALDVASGKRIWQIKTKAAISGGPGVGEGLVLLGTSDAEVIALDQESGDEAWRARVSSEVLAVPKATDNVVVVRTADGKIVGLDAESGERIWFHDRSVPVLTLRGTGSPVVDAGRVIGGFASGKLVALDIHDGKKLWEASVAISRGRSELARLVDIDADPVIRQGVVYVASFQGNVAAVSEDSGVVLWRRDLSSYAGLAADEGQVYVTDDESHLWALDARTGASLWKQDKLHARAATAPVVYGDFVVVGDLEGYLHWMSREDGRLEARTRLDDEPISSPPRVVGDVLYVYDDAGVLAAMRLVGR